MCVYMYVTRYADIYIYISAYIYIYYTHTHICTCMWIDIVVYLLTRMFMYSIYILVLVVCSSSPRRWVPSHPYRTSIICEIASSGKRIVAWQPQWLGKRALGHDGFDVGKLSPSMAEFRLVNAEYLPNGMYSGMFMSTWHLGDAWGHVWTCSAYSWNIYFGEGLKRALESASEMFGMYLESSCLYRFSEERKAPK